LHSVLAAIVSLGWTGFALICFLAVAQFGLLSAAWLVLIPASSRKMWPTFLWGRAVRDSAGDILPLTQLGGYVIGARAVTLLNISATDAFASTVVDVTIEMLAQILFVIAGAVLLALHFGFHLQQSRLFVPLCIGSVLAALGVAGFIIAQQQGHKFAERLVGKLHPKMGAHADAFARAIKVIYAAPRRLIASTAIHFAGWLGIAAIGWIGVRLIGGHIGYGSMVAVESMLSGVRSAAVVVPSAIGIQEATYAMLMPLFGVGPEIGIGLSLIRRACSVTIGIPVLLFWQSLEGRQTLLNRGSAVGVPIPD
jgi:putative membrane protein